MASRPFPPPRELRSKNIREERINTPSDPYNRWQWRMHLTIEELLQADRFNAKLKTMITRSKRGNGIINT